jgi:hypothetical protein
MDKFIALMQKLCISAVYWIDDENAANAELDIEKLASAFADALVAADAVEAKAALAPFLSEAKTRRVGNQLLTVSQDEAADLASRLEQISDLLRSAGGLQQLADPAATLVQGLRKLPGPLRAAEKAALIELFKGEAKVDWHWRPLSFTKWAEGGLDVVKSHTPESPVLVIVDLQNTSEATAADGTTVLSELAAAELDRKACHVIVLTSECKTEEEFRRGRKLTEDFFAAGPAKRVPVFVLSKTRFLRNENDPRTIMADAFASILERADLSLVHLQFAEIMRAHFVRSIDIAFNALDRVTIEELMYAVTHTSKEEGVSEIETLVRLMNIAQRESFQQAIASSDALRTTILALRSAELSIDRAQLESDVEIAKLRCAELYDKPEVINKLYSALSPGDLFVVHSERPSVENHRATEERVYVLVANACDLMLRGSASRRLNTGLLLRLDDADSKDRSFSFALPHLEFTGLPNVGRREIELREYVAVKLSVLDLCWTNDSGKCSWDPALIEEVSNKLLPSQKGRLTALRAEYGQLGAAEIAALARPLEMVHTETLDEHGRVQAVEFHARRIGRLSHGHAAQLTSRFTGVFGRPSAEHDFSKQK